MNTSYWNLTSLCLILGFLNSSLGHVKANTSFISEPWNKGSKVLVLKEDFVPSFEGIGLEIWVCSNIAPYNSSFRNVKVFDTQYSNLTHILILWNRQAKDFTDEKHEVPRGFVSWPRIITQKMEEPGLEGFLIPRQLLFPKNYTILGPLQATVHSLALTKTRSKIRYP